jgi:hypothetical protein
MWLTKHYKSLLNYETSGRDLGFAFPSLGGFAYIEGMVIRCLAHLSLGIRSAQTSNGYSQDFSRLQLFFWDHRRVIFDPIRFLRDADIISKVSVFYLSFMQICFCKISNINVTLFQTRCSNSDRNRPFANVLTSNHGDREFLHLFLSVSP